ncbi:non-specific lipid-transfer protein 2-like [Syzygium oleosum]|uniref:non-specific lipid-transfer protein 2-like n=1 Tax=Syzygium oleosum TaxID=219896 RepID=UPI0024BAB654|nr:non-specific lipid-transfer protein 2-like [Syzygium oleosum]
MAKAEVRLLCFLYIASLSFVIVTGRVGDQPEPVPSMAGNEPEPINDIMCGENIADLLPLLPFLKGSNPLPTTLCCHAVQTVQKLANAKQIRRDQCECFKKAALGLGVDPGKAKALPERCHIHLPVPIDPKIDCSTVPFGTYYNPGA